MDRIKAEHLSDMARTIGNYYVQDGRRYALLAKHLWDEGYRKVPKGEWIMHTNFDGYLNHYECSVCHQAQGHKSNYCEECGADMHEEDY